MIIYTAGILWILLVDMFCRKNTILLENGHEETRVTKVQAFLSMAYLVFFIGLRSAGADTHAYIYGFNMYPTGLGSIWRALFDDEGLFEAFGVAMKTFISKSYYPYLFVIAYVSGMTVSNTLRKYTPYYLSAMMLFMLQGTWTWMINGIRQFVAVSLSFASIGLLLKRKTVGYIVVMLVLSRIHTSALFMIPIYFFVDGEAFSSKSWIMVAIAIAAVLFTSQFTGALDVALQGTAYSDIIGGDYFSTTGGSNPIRTLIFAVPVVLAYLDKENIKKYAPPIIHVSVNMSIICVCISLIANVTSGIYVGRVPIYFSMYNLLLLPWLAHNTTLMFPKTFNALMFGFYSLYYIYDNYIGGGMYYKSDLLGMFVR